MNRLHAELIILIFFIFLVVYLILINKREADHKSYFQGIALLNEFHIQVANESIGLTKNEIEAKWNYTFGNNNVIEKDTVLSQPFFKGKEYNERRLSFFGFEFHFSNDAVSRVSRYKP